MECFRDHFINTGWSNLINFPAFDNWIQHLLYSCSSLSSILYADCEEFVLNAWVFSDNWHTCIICGIGAFALLMARFHETSSIILQQSTHILHSSIYMSNFISTRFTVWYRTFCYVILRTSCCISQYFLTNDGLVSLSKQFQTASVQASIHTVYFFLR